MKKVSAHAWHIVSCISPSVRWRGPLLPDEIICSVKWRMALLSAHSHWLPMEDAWFALVRNEPSFFGLNKGWPCPLWLCVWLKLKVGHPFPEEVWFGQVENYPSSFGGGCKGRPCPWVGCPVETEGLPLAPLPDEVSSTKWRGALCIPIPGKRHNLLWLEITLPFLEGTAHGSGVCVKLKVGH